MFSKNEKKQPPIDDEGKQMQEYLHFNNVKYAFYVYEGDLGMKHICFTEKDVADSFLANIKEKFAGVNALTDSEWEKARVTNNHPRYEDKNYFLIRLTLDQLNYLRELPKEKPSSEDVVNHRMDR